MADEIQYAAPKKKRGSQKAEKPQLTGKKKVAKRICNIVIIVFSALFLLSLIEIIIAQRAYHEVDQVNEELREEYAPVVRPYIPAEVPVEPVDPDSDVSEQPSTSSEIDEPSSEAVSDLPSEQPSEPVEPPKEPEKPPKEPEKKETEYESLVRMQKKYPDVVGWIIMDGTHINNVFVQGKDNEEYVRSNLSTKYLISGTLFLDYESSDDFSAFNNVIYGHNMRNGSMFGDLDYYEKKSYFDKHKTGTVCFPDASWHLEAFAFLVVKSTDATVYDCNVETEEEKQAFLDYVKENARQYRDIGVTTADTLLTLSTCNYEFDGARCILVCKAINY